MQLTLVLHSLTHVRPVTPRKRCSNECLPLANPCKWRYPDATHSSLVTLSTDSILQTYQVAAGTRLCSARVRRLHEGAQAQASGRNARIVGILTRTPTVLRITRARILPSSCSLVVGYADGEVCGRCRRIAAWCKLQGHRAGKMNPERWERRAPRLLRGHDVVQVRLE